MEATTNKKKIFCVILDFHRINALKDNILFHIENYRYLTPDDAQFYIINVSGLEILRKQVAKYHHKKNKYKYSPDNVVIGPGSKELIFQTQLVLNCDLILPSPSWVSYEPQAQILKKKVYWLPTSYESNWHSTLQTILLEHQIQN